jgi:Na+-transporting NADH:ubiquinone oxidoreductase subunit C
MKQFSNLYIVIFSTIMVVVVAMLLALAYLRLKPRQIKNEELEQMKNILASVNISSDVKNVEKKFNKYIVESYVINVKGERIKDIDAFTVDMKEEQTKIKKINELSVATGVKKRSPFGMFLGSIVRLKEKDRTAIESQLQRLEKTRQLPVFICRKDNKTYYIFSMIGKGLWGPIWGYLSVEDDFNTVYGTYFGHESETPGLGAKISTRGFQARFRGKKLFQDSQFVSIKVVKGGAPPGDLHGVDAISGSTITSRGVENMLNDCLSGYVNFINKQKKTL